MVVLTMEVVGGWWWSHRQHRRWAGRHCQWRCWADGCGGGGGSLMLMVVVMLMSLLLLLVVVVVALLTLGVGRQEGEGLRENSKVKVSGWEIITQNSNCGSIV